MRAIKIAVVTAAAVALPLAAGCSSSKTSGPHTTGAASSPSTTSSAPPSTTSAPPSTSTSTSTSAQSGTLSGSWSGSYSGAYSGTFTLTWTQTGAALAGTINLSTAGTEPLTGTVNGDSITFGAVGSAAIAYTGTVSGDSMSGHYTIAGGAGGTGSWSAHRG